MRRKRPSSRRAADKCDKFASPHRRPLKQKVLPYHAVGYIVHHGKFGLLMSALGQKRTLGKVQLMSALPPKADIRCRDRYVRFVPKADICSAAIRDLLEQVLTNFCQQVARAVRLRHVVITSRCARYTFFPIQCM
jgi:hypothetical protein